MVRCGFRNSVRSAVVVSWFLTASWATAFAQGNPPVILIPGIAGSELRHRVTNERVWFKTVKSRSEDIRLPLQSDPTAMHDDLIPTDVIRGVKVGPITVSDIYGEFITAMSVRGGYHEEKWSAPSSNGDHDALYVWPYDWRLDIVTNARRLVRDIETLKAKLNRPDLKFDLIGHSMGGLISRYALMYGDIDLTPAGSAFKPTWSGAAFIDRIVLMDTPNDGSPMALDALINGYTYNGVRIDLPGVQDTSRFTVFSIPSIYQLLPAPGKLRVFDDGLKPVNIDIYDPHVWSRYGWNPIEDSNIVDHFPADERRAARPYFEAALQRARRLHEALAASDGKSGGVTFFAVGADCSESLRAFVLYQDKKNRWKTVFMPRELKRKDGSRLAYAEMKKVMYAKGDGVVTVGSLTGREPENAASIYNGNETKMFCEEHYRLGANPKIQDYIISVLNRKVTPAMGTPGTR